ncbi:MAG: 4Fe-4S binding protein [Thermomicrobiales bacterium]
MVSVLRRAARRGIATRGYPDTPEEAPPAYRGQVMLRTERCIGDGGCARACPSAAITVSSDAAGGWVWELDDARCVFCGLCAEACPTSALFLSNEFELAVRRRGELVTRVAFSPPRNGNASEESS